MNEVDDVTRLAVAAAGGDRVALRAFVRATQPDVWRFCAALVDRASADDLTQDVYARALAGLAGYRGDAPARVWLLSIARRTCADALRRRMRRRRLAERLARRRSPDSTPSPDNGVELRGLVDALAPDRRAAFVLTQLLGLTYAETAAALGVPVGTVRSRVARARGDLADALDTGRGESDTG